MYNILNRTLAMKSCTTLRRMLFEVHAANVEKGRIVQYVFHIL